MGHPADVLRCSHVGPYPVLPQLSERAMEWYVNAKRWLALPPTAVNSTHQQLLR